MRICGKRFGKMVRKIPPSVSIPLPRPGARQLSSVANLSKRSLFGVAALGYALACQSPARKPVKRTIASITTARQADAPARRKIEALLKRDERLERDEPPEDSSTGPAKPRKQWLVDDLVDVAPAGPAAASDKGVVLVTRENGIRLAELQPSPKSSRAGSTPVTALDADPKDFVARARGPAVVGNAAYWVEGSHLVRQSLNGGPKETLANDARAYTQVSGPGGPSDAATVMVAYVAVSAADPQSLIAKLWVQGQGSQTLSPEGTTANTVALVPRGTDWLALSLEGRTGMSPLHARSISLTSSGAKLGSDFIAWIAGSAQPMTMVHGLSDEQSTWALMPIERDIARFGLVRVKVGESQNPNQEVFWRNYPNGIDPAPTATGHLCGKPVVLYARPSAAAPHAPQELHLAAIVDSGLGPSTLIGSSRAFWDVSLAPLDSGALVVYVADHRTWARRLRCAR